MQYLNITSSKKGKSILLGVIVTPDISKWKYPSSDKREANIDKVQKTGYTLNEHK